MSVAEIIDRQLAAWNAQDADAVAADFGPDSTYWSPTVPHGDLAGPAAAHADAAMLFTAFPDFALVERGRLVDGDRTAALWWDVTATFRGPLEPPGFAPTGGPVTNHGVTWVQAEGDRITRLHLYFDVNELGRQIGAIPPPGSAGEKMVVTFQKLTAKGLRKRDWSH
ncbi:MAG TPA: nuclear transport factor 2 family protein [Miltoncostaeaceae bacterium]|nr:nuclear transport factor 2 family protein [Miltoncostaeaceae bacterium]